MDKRVQRSKKVLKDAMLALLNEKEFSKITVLELVKRADINRSTFYFHYYSKDELMEEMIDDLMNGINEKLYTPFQNKSKISVFDTLYSKSIEVFQYIYENKSSFSILMKSHLNIFLRHRIYEEFYNFGNEKSIYKYKSENLMDTNLYIHFRMAALVGMIIYWIEEDIQLTPVEFAQEYDKFISNPAAKFIDIR